MKKIIGTLSLFCGAIFALFSCQEEIAPPKIQEFSICAEVEDLSKSVIDGTSFRWTEDDKFGLYLDQKVSPVYNALCTVLSLSGDGTRANLACKDDLPIDMTGSRKVAAFYPYKSFSESSSKLLLSVPQVQKQTDSKASHLSKYDFMSSRPQQHESGKTISLKFRHHMSKIDFFFLNEHSQSLTVTDIEIRSSNGKKVFATTASLDLFSEDPSLTPREENKVSHLGVALSGEWCVVKPDESLTASIMMIPLDLQDEELQIVVNTREKGEFIYEKVGLDFLPQNRYRVVLSAREKDLVVNTDELTILDSKDNASFKITAINGLMQVNLTSDVSWMSFSRDTISLEEGESQTITVCVDRKGLKNGKTVGNISLKSGDIEKSIKVNLFTTGLVETISPSDELIVDFVGCEVEAGVGKISFNITNVSSLSCVIGIGTSYSSSYSSNTDSYSLLYDEYGNEYPIKYCTIGDERSNSYSSVTSYPITAGQTLNCSIETDDVIGNDAGFFSQACIGFYYNYHNLGTHYGDIVLKNIPINQRTKGSKADALNVEIEKDNNFNDVEFEVYNIGFSGDDAKVYYRIYNGASSDYFFNISNSTLFCYDNAGDSYTITNNHLGMKDNDYCTRIPSGIWCNGMITIKSVARKLSTLKHISIKFDRQVILSRSSLTSLNYGNTEYATLTIKNLPCGRATDPEPETPVSTIGKYESLPEGIEMEVIKEQMQNNSLTVHYRLLNKTDRLKRISLSTASRLSFAIDDRGNYYGLSDFYLACNTDWAYLVPGLYCKGSFTVEDMDSKTTSLKYLSLNTYVYDEYSSNYSNEKIILNDIDLPGKTPSSYQMPAPTTKADSVWVEGSEDFEASVVSCVSNYNTNTTTSVIRLKNISDSQKSLRFQNERFSFDNIGNYCAISNVFIGGIKKKSEITIPPGYQMDLEFTSSNVSKNASCLAYSRIGLDFYNEKNSTKNGCLYIKDLAIEGRNPDYTQPEVTTHCDSIVSWDPGMEVQLLSCKMEENDAIVTLKVRNTTIKSVSFSLSASSSSNGYQTYAFDGRGNKYSVETVTIGNNGLTSCTLVPNVWCYVKMKICDIGSDTGILTHTRLYSSTFGSQLQLYNLKIEGREEQAMVWPSPQTSFGQIESLSSNISFKGLSSSIDYNGTLTVKCLMTNETDYTVEFTPNANASYGSYLIDDQGNYYSFSRIQFGNWYTSGQLDVQLPPRASCYCYFKATDFCVEASQIKILSLGTNTSIRNPHLIIHDIKIQDRDSVAFPSSKTTCSSISSGDSALDTKLLRCYIDEYGTWRIVVSITNKTNNIKVMDSYFYYWYYGSSYTYNSYTYSRNMSLNNNSNFVLWPGVPAVIVFKNTSMNYDGDVFPKLIHTYDIKTGYAGTTTSCEMVLTDINIEGRQTQ